MYILSFNILTHNIPAIPNASMETARRPHMLATPFFEMRKFFSQYSARSSFQSLCNKTERIFRSKHHMIRQQRHRMPVMPEFFHSSLPAHIHRYNFGKYKQAASGVKVFLLTKPNW
jgi:hypothetical protein